MNPLLSFQKEILDQCLSTPSGLWIVAPGLGMLDVVQYMLLQEEANNPANQAIFVLNAADPGRQLHMFPPHRFSVVNAEYSAQQRVTLYRRGGILFVTSRVLVVDMLKGRIPNHLVKGFVVLQAHVTTDSSTEAFILRLFSMQQHQHQPSVIDVDGTVSGGGGFIRAFSDAPYQFSSGFSKAEKIMKNLNVTKLFLYPRFRASVATCLNAHQPQVVVLYADMTPRQRAIHDALIKIIGAVIDEILAIQTGSSSSSSSTSSITSTTTNPAATSAEGSGSGGGSEGGALGDIFTKRVLSLENNLFRSFHEMLRGQMEPHLNRLSWKTRNLIKDLDSLRKLLMDLVRSDAVSFYLRQREWSGDSGRTTRGGGYTGGSSSSSSSSSSNPAGSMPGWMLMEEAETVFKLSKQRLWWVPPPSPSTSNIVPTTTVASSSVGPDSDVVVIGEDAPTSTSHSPKRRKIRDDENESDGDDILEKEVKTSIVETSPNKPHPHVKVPSPTPVLQLEAPPKWQLMEEILKEITVDCRNNNHLTPHVVVVVRDSFSASALSEFLVTGSRKVMLRKFETMLATRRAAGADGGAGGGAQHEHHGEAKNIAVGGGSSGDNNNNNSNTTTPSSTSLSTVDVLHNVVQQEKASLSEDQKRQLLDQPTTKAHSTSITDETLFALARAPSGTTSSSSSDRVPHVLILASNSGGGGSRGSSMTQPLASLLEEVDPQPSFIILYEPDQTQVREVECWKARSPGHAVRVYLLTYRDSVEEQKYRSAVGKEKSDFEQLVREKANMATQNPADRLRLHLGAAREGLASIQTSSDNSGSGTNTVALTSTRRGGGMYSRSSSSSLPVIPTVIVDVREFRSKLPGLLHAQGMMVVPKTLLVADYILSPQIAVERKSLSDLYQSFSSGRLYNQAEQMTRLFTKPILLIEFDQSQPFALPHDPPKSYATIPTTSKGDFGKGGKKWKKNGSTEGGGGGGSGGPTDDINVSQIRSKLVILTLHFPRLRIIWSRSPYETAQLFQELKVGQEEPESTSGGNDVDDDVSISFHAAGGGGSSSSSALHDRDPDESNPELFECVDILHKLPGISDRNAFLVLRGSTASPSSAPSSSSSVTGAGLMAPHNLAELAQLSAQQLGELLHSPAEGAQLSKFFTHNFHQHRYQPGAQYHQDDDDGNDGGEGQLVDNPN